ncbi:MAG: MBL fold metallo-hydrolase [Candidatus Pacebacteria bacterium]|nr:MBL fold metallo-hydrolase [Candidatus Paceibacterota bacterium]
MKRGFILISLLILNILIWPLALTATEPVLKVAFLDVGQGDAIYIEAPNGNQVLIDGGRDRGLLRPLGEVLPWDDKTLDLIIATHPDADHIGGLPAVLERYEVAGVMHNGDAATTQIYRTFMGEMKEEEDLGGKVMLATRGTQINLSDNIYLKVLWPLPGTTPGDTNDYSVVIYLTDGYHDFLLTGDAPLLAENYLLKSDGELVDVEVLKAGHHGSRTSSGGNFINATSPLFAIISAGADNNYGHPHREVMTRLAGSGAQILETSKEGTIICESMATKLVCN